MAKRNIHPRKPVDPSNAAKGPALVEVVGLAVGLLLLYLVAELVLAQGPHPTHWLVAGLGGFLGFVLGRIYYRLRGDII